MGRVVTRPIYYLRKDFGVANRHDKRLEQIVNRKPSARLRPSDKEKHKIYLIYILLLR